MGGAQIDPNLMNSLTLAYMGDAVIEVYVRREIIAASTHAKPHVLHARAVNYVSAKSQAAFLHELIDEGFLSEEEQNIVRRGRNVKSHSVPRNTDVQTYNFSTGFEALIGSLYFSGENGRIDAIMEKMFLRRPVEGGHS